MYIKWATMALCFWQMGFFNAFKYMDIKASKTWFTIVLLIRVFLHVPLKFPGFNLD